MNMQRAVKRSQVQEGNGSLIRHMVQASTFLNNENGHSPVHAFGVYPCIHCMPRTTCSNWSGPSFSLLSFPGLDGFSPPTTDSVSFWCRPYLIPTVEFPRFCRHQFGYLRGPRGGVHAEQAVYVGVRAEAIRR